MRSQVSQLTGQKNIEVQTLRYQAKKETVRRFTLQQYYTLLNLFSESEEVLAVFGKYSTEQSSVCSLEELQNGALGLCTVVHPTIAYVLQLKSIVKKNDDEIEGRMQH